MRIVLERGALTEEYEPEMVMKINIQGQLNRLRVCPCCGQPLGTVGDSPLVRACMTCGEFTITAVYTDGDVEFTFVLVAEDKPQEGDPVDAPVVDTNV